jgi:hypothetical protein
LPTLQDWLQDVANVWPVVWANRATLIPILVGVVVLEWVILSFWYSGRLASKEAEIRLQARQLADHRVASPEEAPGMTTSEIDTSTNFPVEHSKQDSGC